MKHVLSKYSTQIWEKSCDVVNYKKDFKESHFIHINLILFLIILSFKNLDGAH